MKVVIMDVSSAAGGQSQPQSDQVVLETNAGPQWKTVHVLDSRRWHSELSDSGFVGSTLWEVIKTSDNNAK